MRALDRGEVFLVTRNGIPVGERRPARRRYVSRDLVGRIGSSASRRGWTRCLSMLPLPAPTASSTPPPLLVSANPAVREQWIC
jgi:hypothetical protein